MRRLFLLFEFLVFLSIGYSQSSSFYFNVHAPEFVSVNSNFNVCVITRLPDIPIDELDFYLLVDNKLSLEGAYCLSLGQNQILKFNNTDVEGIYEKAYKINFVLPDSLHKFAPSYEFLFDFSSHGSKHSEISFMLDLKYMGESSKVYSSMNYFDSNILLPKADIEFFEPQVSAGKALSFGSKSEFSFSFPGIENITDWCIEFWAKFNTAQTSFFNILDIEKQNTLLSLKKNNYSMIFSEAEIPINFYDEFFLSKNSWNHVTLFLNSEINQLELFVNDLLITSITIQEALDFSKLIFEFKNSSTKNHYEIDLLNVWEIRNDVKTSFDNKHYLSYSLDESRLLAKFNFDDESFLEKQGKDGWLETKFENVKLVHSNAPIFSRAPKLNINIYEEFYSIEWQNTETSQVEAYVLEKSIDGNTFQSIFTVASEDDPEKIYYYSDPAGVQNQVTFYRVKQINKDKTTVYSSNVKIGQGEKEIFTLNQNYPNPFNPVTTISVELFENSEVEILVYDLVGKKIVTLYAGRLSEGFHTYNFDGSDLPSGIYFYEVKTPVSTRVRKMILAK